MMDNIELVFLDILKASLAGEHSALPELTQGDISVLTKMAFEHKVLPLIYEASYTTLANPTLRNMVRRDVMVQTVKTSEFLQLYRLLLDRGLHPVVVKGIICRSLYPMPDHRISADEDLLIPAAELEAARSVLEEFGMATTESNPDAYEFPYRKAKSPLYIELHKNLFPQDNQAYGSWNRLFDYVFDDLHIETVNGLPIYTMKPTDHLLYLLCHALKHFMHSGFGIRQVCDIVMFASRWGSAIEWEYLLEACESIDGAYFAAAVFRIGTKYLGFDQELACYPECWQSMALDETEMLQDLLSSGIYGSSSVNRMHSSNMTLDAVAASRKQGSARASVWGSVFPSAAKLEARYPYLKNNSWLLPVAWCQRLLQFGKETVSHSKTNALDAVKVGAKRVELLRQYGVIK